MLGIVSYHPDVQAVGNSESDSIVDALAVNKSDEQGAVEPTTNIVVEEPAIDGSKPKDGQTMNKEVDASPVAVVKLLKAVCLSFCSGSSSSYGCTRFCANRRMQTNEITETVEQSLVEKKKDGVTTLCIANHGKTTCQLQTGIQIAKACEVDFDLNNKDSKSITSNCWEGAPCEPHKDLKQMPPNEMDVNIPAQDDIKLRMVSFFIRW